MIDEPLSRRHFLQLLGAACALAGGSGLAGLLSGCGKDDVGTNTTATIPAAHTTTTTPRPTTTSTTVTTTVETARPLRIGVLTARSGRLALFGRGDDWWMDFATRSLPDGIVGGDAKMRKFTFMVEDHQSSADLAAKAAVRLISEARVDLLMSSGAASVVNKAAAQAENLECPFMCDFVPWRPFIFDRGGSLDKPFTWTYAHAYGFEDIARSFLSAWDQVSTNKKVALVLPDDTHGHFWADPQSGLPPAAVEAGYECVLPGFYPAPAGDFTDAIADYKKNGCEICFGYMTSSDLTTFWEQAQQQKFRPKLVSMAGALLFPQAVQAMGSQAANMMAESLWQPDWPYRDSITGKSAQELADDYAIQTQEQWTVALAQYAKFEWAVDVFKRVEDPLDRRDTLSRLRTTRLNTCLGLIDFTAPVIGDPSRSKRPAENIYKAPVAACQWVNGTKYPYESRVVSLGSDRGLPVTGTLQPMIYPTETEPPTTTEVSTELQP